VVMQHQATVVKFNTSRFKLNGYIGIACMCSGVIVIIGVYEVTIGKRRERIAQNTGAKE